VKLDPTVSLGLLLTLAVTAVTLISTFVTLQWRVQALERATQEHKERLEKLDAIHSDLKVLVTILATKADLQDACRSIRENVHKEKS
jgi:hypothetical protein